MPSHVGRPQTQLAGRPRGVRWPSLLSLVANLGFSAPASAADWPQFRGPYASGVADGGFPTHFGPETNVVWKAPVPGGNSSPVLQGDRLFLTAFADGQLQVLAYARADGRELWRRTLPPGVIERGARLGHPATATPATDGERLITYFGPFGLAAFALDGKELWQLPLPVPVTQHGAGTSPVLAGDLVLLNLDQDLDSHLLAVDRRTGKVAWRTERPEARRGFSTPLVWPPEAPEVAVIAGTLRLTAYHLHTGLEAWRVEGLPNEMVSSPIGGDGRLYVAGWTAGSGVGRMPAWDGLLTAGDADHDGALTREEAPDGPARQHFAYLDANKDGRLAAGEYAAAAHAFDTSRNVALAIRPGGSGNVTATHVVWSHSKGLPYCPTPLLHHGRLYLIRNGGLITCLDAATGRPFYQEERLGALGDNYASPVASGDQVCVFSQAGIGVVVRDGERLEVVARNALGESVVATPALADGRLYVRTATTLHAFGTPATDRKP